MAEEITKISEFQCTKTVNKWEVSEQFRPKKKIDPIKAVETHSFLLLIHSAI